MTTSTAGTARPLPEPGLPEPGSDDDTVVFDAIRPAPYPWRAPIWWPAVAGLFGGRTGDRRYPAGRRNHVLGGLAGAALVLLGLFGAGAGLGLVVGAPALPSLSQTHLKATGPAATAMSRSTPTRISIPTIGVSAPIMTVGLAKDGTIGTPPLSNNNLAAWYSGGPSPGQMGPAIVVGHVDGPKGESVFYKLGKLKSGQLVQMDLADHKVAMFSIYSVEYYPKGKFPGDRVYGDYSRPGLRLITCGGRFLGGSTGYADNVVVYASLKSRG
jgi:Sortase domain